MRARAVAGENVLGLRDLVGGSLAQEIAEHRPVRCGLAVRNEIFEMRAHRVRHTPQQHDRDIAFAAFELGDVALGNAGDFCEHLARHAAQRPRGTHPLAELLEKFGFGVAVFRSLSRSGPRFAQGETRQNQNGSRIWLNSAR